MQTRASRLPATTGKEVGCSFCGASYGKIGLASSRGRTSSASLSLRRTKGATRPSGTRPIKGRPGTLLGSRRDSMTGRLTSHAGGRRGLSLGRRSSAAGGRCPSATTFSGSLRPTTSGFRLACENYGHTSGLRFAARMTAATRRGRPARTTPCGSSRSSLTLLSSGAATLTRASARPVFSFPKNASYFPILLPDN